MLKKLYFKLLNKILNKIIIILLRITKYQINNIDLNLKIINLVLNELKLDDNFYFLQLLKIEFSEKNKCLGYTFYNHNNLNNIDLLKSIYFSLFNTLAFYIFNDRKALTITLYENNKNKLTFYLIVDNKTTLEQFIELFNNKISFNFYTLIQIDIYKF